MAGKTLHAQYLVQPSEERGVVHWHIQLDVANVASARSGKDSHVQSTTVEPEIAVL